MMTLDKGPMGRVWPHNPGNLPNSRSLLNHICRSLLPCKEAYSQVPGIRKRTYLENHSSAYYIMMMMSSLLCCSPFLILQWFQDKIQILTGHGQLMVIWSMPIFLASALLPHVHGALQEGWTTHNSIATCSLLLTSLFPTVISAQNILSHFPSSTSFFLLLFF